jgi:integrase
MASKFQRRQKWWIKFRHPVTGQRIRESLDTADEARAELLRQRLDLEVALLEPRFQAAEIPDAILRALGTSAARTEPAPAAVPLATAQSLPAAATVPHKRATVDEALAAYLRYIASQNAPHHVANKVSILRRFLGTDRVEKAGGPVKTKRRRLGKNEVVADPPPFFTGEHLDEITPTLVQNFIEGLGLGRKTMRHYREMFHHFFEFCLKFDLYVPGNWHRPNPIAALPSYVTRNRRITFLTEADVDAQIAALSGEPAMQIAVQIMIHAGLRRAETLWLTRDSIAPDLSFLSVRNCCDQESDIESSLKTGERAVTILPPLREALRRYLPTLQGRWVVPNGAGRRWRSDCFSKHLRVLNKSAGLAWTCLPYRHTYATRRAAEGWSLFTIAKEMGNSAAVVEEYYAAYIRPAALGASMQGNVMNPGHAQDPPPLLGGFLENPIPECGKPCQHALTTR